jgi:hypothetical protein
VVESVSATLKGQLGLERHGGRTAQGVGTRIAQRLLALAIAQRLLALAAVFWHNRAIHALHKRGLTAYDH